MNMTSNCDVTKTAHHKQMTTMCHWMKPPLWKSSAYATDCFSVCVSSVLPFRSNQNLRLLVIRGASWFLYFVVIPLSPPSMSKRCATKHVNSDKGRTQGGLMGLTPLEFDMLQKVYNLHKGNSLFSHTFCLLICRLNANTTEWICMQISRNMVNGPKSNN